jgi:16S rRNA pseudouridine516 synthase
VLLGSDPVRHQMRGCAAMRPFCRGLLPGTNRPPRCPASPAHARRDLLPPRWRRRRPPLSTAGSPRLEHDGFPCHTDDGALLHRIISPKSVVENTNRATLACRLAGDEAARFALGDLTLRGEATTLAPARLTVTCVRDFGTGRRYHQVRRIFAAVCDDFLPLISRRCTATRSACSSLRDTWRRASSGE